MTDSESLSSEGTEKVVVQAPNLPLMVHAQYVKDISFENPHAPHSLRAGLETPRMDVNITLDARALEDDKIKSLYEVVLRIAARAERKEQTVYVAEVLYAVCVSLPNVPEEHHHPVLLVEVPKLAFPYARKILADLTQDGGFSPLMLGPVDFHSMYISRFAAKDDSQKSN